MSRSDCRLSATLMMNLIAFLLCAVAVAAGDPAPAPAWDIYVGSGGCDVSDPLCIPGSVTATNSIVQLSLKADMQTFSQQRTALDINASMCVIVKS